MQNKRRKSYKAKALTLTLCPRCKADFRDSGHLLAKKGWQPNQETCDLCNVRKGFAYDVYERRG